MKAVIIERDYKGIFERYALPRDTFVQWYPDSAAPTEDSNTDTISPLVHLWYQVVEVGGEMWSTFFTDMTWGLEHEGEDGADEAYIRWSYVDPDLVEYVVLSRESALSAKKPRPDVFYKTRWCDADLAHELDANSVPPTEENVAALRKAIDVTTFDDVLCEAAWSYLDRVISDKYSDFNFTESD